jgi:hypothetical protein
MSDFSIHQIGYLPNARFSVTINGEHTTRHTVSFNQEVYDMLTGGNAPAKELVQKAFEYLLERESGNQIKPVFDLLEIQRYFGGFVASMKIQFGV